MRSGQSGAWWTIRRPPVDEGIEHEAPAALDRTPRGRIARRADRPTHLAVALVSGIWSSSHSRSSSSVWTRGGRSGSSRSTPRRFEWGSPRTSSRANMCCSALSWYPLSARVVHSTSWRYEGGAIVLSYVAVVDPPARLPGDSLVSVPIERSGSCPRGGHLRTGRGRCRAGARTRAPSPVVAGPRRPCGRRGADRLAGGAARLRAGALPSPLGRAARPRAGWRRSSGSGRRWSGRRRSWRCGGRAGPRRRHRRRRFPASA